jgi:hypothetical protein
MSSESVSVFAKLKEHGLLLQTDANLPNVCALVCLLPNLHRPPTLCARSLGVGLPCPALLSCSQEPAQIRLPNVWRRRPTSLRRSSCYVKMVFIREVLTHDEYDRERWKK